MRSHHGSCQRRRIRAVRAGGADMEPRAIVVRRGVVVRSIVLAVPRPWSQVERHIREVAPWRRVPVWSLPYRRSRLSSGPSTEAVLLAHCASTPRALAGLSVRFPGSATYGSLPLEGAVDGELRPGRPQLAGRLRSFVALRA